MLTFQDHVRTAGRWHRRQFLRAGGLALGGLTLSDWFAVRAAAAKRKLPLKDRSVIFLFMHGGPSQFETFDPKMDAPSSVRSATGEIKTTLPGVTFGSTFKQLAKLAHKFSVVRSFVTGDGNHDIKPVVGMDTLRANMGSLYSSIAGASRMDTAMPTNVVLFPRSIDPKAMPPVTEFGNFEGTGELSRTFAPFVPGAGANLQQDMRLNLPEGRFENRRALLSALDDWKRWADSSDAVEGFSAFQQQAFSTLHRGVSDAFDLSQEDSRLVERYDTAPLLPRDRISKQWKNIDHYATNALTLGRQLLLARRLCERGAGFVTVTTSFIWDMHADENNAPMTVGMEYVGAPFDRAVSAFIEDIEARGLSEKILLVCCGEMGRTPSINKNGGRDHWGNLAPLLLYGGGLKMGRVIGQSSRDGGEPASDAVTMQDLLATVMHTLLDISEVRLMPGIPRRVVEAMTRGEPIPRFGLKTMPANPFHSCGSQAHPGLRVTRRSAIQAGAVGLLGLGFNHLAALKALAAPATGAPPKGRAKSVIYIFLSGGLAQHESFDLKPEAPEEIRGEFQPIPTRTPGIQICEHLPELAKRSPMWALVRSLTHPSNDHSAGHHIMLTGRTELPEGFDPNKPKPSDWPAIAALASALVPPRHNLPPAIVLPDKIVHNSGRTLPGQFAGLLGPRHEPWFLEMSPYHPQHYGAFPEFLFHHEKGRMTDDGLRFHTPHLALPQGLTMGRLLDRVALRDAIERQSRELADAAGDGQFGRYREAAVSLLSNTKVHDAFDLEKADPRLLDRYGRNTFGWSLLMARRLVATGVSLIQVNLGNDETWDTHQSAFPNLKDYLLPPLDRAVSALLDDLEASGQLGETLIVMGSEFGRTPKISTLPGAALPGRDHWGACQTVFLAGGGVRGGTVVGASDAIGAYPDRDPQKPENLAATIYEALGLPRSITWNDTTARPHFLYNADPIKGLM